MVLTRTDENELLTALHGGLFQEMPWRLFLNRLRDRTEADQCRLLVRPAEESVWREADSVVARSHAAESVAAGAPALDLLRTGRVYAGDELGQAAEAEGGTRHMRVSAPDAGDLALSIVRYRDDFRARDASLLASLAPHLAIALRGRMELERERRRSALSAWALGGFAEGWLLLDARGRVLDQDRGAARMLEGGRVVRRAADGRVRFLLAEAETLMEKTIALPEMPEEPRGEWMSVDPLIQMVVARPPVVKDAASLPAAHCLVVMRQLTLDRPADGRFLPALFHLTPSETALAARIAGGSSLTEAAEALGLTIETARNYSKRIYVKLGARGQADLVRLVLDSVRAPG